MAIGDAAAGQLTAAGRALLASGATFAAAGVALSAYAAHAVGDGARASLQAAALMALVHGACAAALVRQRPGRRDRIALAAMLIGVVLFSGSLVAAHALDTPTRLAPVGGGLLIVAWLALALGALAD